jgi:hypothetical protein
VVTDAGGIDRQIALCRMAGGLFVPASRVAVAALVFGELTQRVEPPGQQGPYRESAGQVHSLIEVLGGARFAAG